MAAAKAKQSQGKSRQVKASQGKVRCSLEESLLLQSCAGLHASGCERGSDSEDSKDREGGRKGGQAGLTLGSGYWVQFAFLEVVDARLQGRN